MKTNYYAHKKICVTGGAGFIGHHVVDKLIDSAERITILDNLSTGSTQHILRIWKAHGLRYTKTASGYTADNGNTLLLLDLKDYAKTVRAIDGHEIVFHLAAVHGGRGFIMTHPADCCENFAINANVIRASQQAEVDRIQFASSACVYPQDLQNSYQSTYRLKENDAWKRGWGNADCSYGWTKLMGELTLREYHRQYGLKGAITRYVTVYGPFENDTHAIMALIRRAVGREDPYRLWGSGRQDRDFTYVEDIVSGTLAACEGITNADAVNIGTGVRHSLSEVAQMIFDIIGWKPRRIIYDRSKPEGVKSRALCIAKAKRVIGYQPAYSLRQGLEKTIAWFIREKPPAVETL